MVPRNLTFKSAPEYASVAAFVEFLGEEERESFTADELSGLAYRVEKSHHALRLELETHGLTLAVREKVKQVRGFSSNCHDRWSGSQRCG